MIFDMAMEWGETIRCFLRFLWRRDSESVSILIIDVAHWLDTDQMKGMADYLTAYAEARVR